VKGFVVDASVAISWCVPAQASDVTDGLLDDILTGSAVMAPSLWAYATANALLILRRRKKIDSDEYAEARVLLDRLPLSLDGEGARLAGTRVADLAIQHELTVYNAAYIELAVRKQVSLATRDDGLRRAAQRLGVTLSL
jgi:predicted nucleic acid-binding protein